MPLHEYSELAASLGAKIFICKDLSDAERLAQSYFEKQNHRETFKIPLGFNGPLFIQLLVGQLRVQWDLLRTKYQLKPMNIWIPVGSGTLTRAFLKIIPPHINLQCIDVGVLQPSDSRIKALWGFKNLKLASAPERFMEQAIVPAPIPSNLHYDAKLWRFILTNGSNSDLWWNVAR